MARILIADDHDVVRTGIRAILEREPGWQVCGEAPDGHEAVELAKRLRPDVVVLDFFMPRVNGIDAARQILRDKPDQKILFLTVMDAEDTAREMLEVGARGYVLKSDAAHDLVAAINNVMRDRFYFTACVSHMVLEGYLRPDSSAGKTILGLTLREREIVQLLAEGYVTKEVANMLGLSVKTIETHRANIMRKLEIHSVAELVLYAVRNNLVQSASSNWWHAAVA
jgi:DNA-binding NarL/FixJ family response regulator